MKMDRSQAGLLSPRDDKLVPGSQRSFANPVSTTIDAAFCCSDKVVEKHNDVDLASQAHKSLRRVHTASQTDWRGGHLLCENKRDLHTVVLCYTHVDHLTLHSFRLSNILLACSLDYVP